MQNIIVGRYGPNEGTIVPVSDEAQRLLDNQEPYHGELRDDGYYIDGQLVGTIRQDWQGWIEPDDKNWIMFVRADGSPVVYLHRDTATGGVRTP